MRETIAVLSIWNTSAIASISHFCISKITTMMRSVSTILSGNWTRNQDQLSKPQWRTRWKRYGFVCRTCGTLKECRNTFMLDGFRPCIIPSPNASCSYDTRSRNPENLQNDPSVSQSKHVRAAGSTPKVGPHNMVVGYRTPNNFQVSLLVQVPSPSTSYNNLQRHRNFSYCLFWSLRARYRDHEKIKLSWLYLSIEI